MQAKYLHRFYSDLGVWDNLPNSVPTKTSQCCSIWNLWWYNVRYYRQASSLFFLIISFIVSWIVLSLVGIMVSGDTSGSRIWCTRQRPLCYIHAHRIRDLSRLALRSSPHCGGHILLIRESALSASSSTTPKSSSASICLPWVAVS